MSDPNPSFFGVLLPRLGWYSKISVFLTNFQSKPFSHQCQPRQISPSSFGWRSFHLLQMVSLALFSGDQAYYSSSSEACQGHQKLNSFTPFPSIAAYSTNFIPQIIIHPRNMQFMERFTLLLLSCILQLAIFQIYDINSTLSLYPLAFSFLPLLGLCLGHHGLSST